MTYTYIKVDDMLHLPDGGNDLVFIYGLVEKIQRRTDSIIVTIADESGRAAIKLIGQIEGLEESQILRLHRIKRRTQSEGADAYGKIGQAGCAYAVWNAEDGHNQPCSTSTSNFTCKQSDIQRVTELRELNSLLNGLQQGTSKQNNDLPTVSNSPRRSTVQEQQQYTPETRTATSPNRGEVQHISPRKSISPQRPSTSRQQLQQVQPLRPNTIMTPLCKAMPKRYCNVYAQVVDVYADPSGTQSIVLRVWDTDEPNKAIRRRICTREIATDVLVQGNPSVIEASNGKISDIFCYDYHNQLKGPIKSGDWIRLINLKIALSKDMTFCYFAMHERGQEFGRAIRRIAGSGVSDGNDEENDDEEDVIPADLVTMRRTAIEAIKEAKERLERRRIEEEELERQEREKKEREEREREEMDTTTNLNQVSHVGSPQRRGHRVDIPSSPSSSNDDNDNCDFPSTISSIGLIKGLHELKNSLVDKYFDLIAQVVYVARDKSGKDVLCVWDGSDMDKTRSKLRYPLKSLDHNDISKFETPPSKFFSLATKDECIEVYSMSWRDHRIGGKLKCGDYVRVKNVSLRMRENTYFFMLMTNDLMTNSSEKIRVERVAEYDFFFEPCDSFTEMKSRITRKLQTVKDKLRTEGKWNKDLSLPVELIRDEEGEERTTVDRQRKRTAKVTVENEEDGGGPAKRTRSHAIVVDEVMDEGVNGRSRRNHSFPIQPFTSFRDEWLPREGEEEERQVSKLPLWFSDIMASLNQTSAGDVVQAKKRPERSDGVNVLAGAKKGLLLQRRIKAMEENGMDWMRECQKCNVIASVDATECCKESKKESARLVIFFPLDNGMDDPMWMFLNPLNHLRSPRSMLITLKEVTVEWKETKKEEWQKLKKDIARQLCTGRFSINSPCRIMYCSGIRVLVENK